MSRDERWLELCRNPSETLEVELKGWLDLSSKADRANLAQAILALANHGGGAVLVGFDEMDEQHVETEPEDGVLAKYTTDAVNGIVERYADPAFHCTLSIVKGPGLRASHPVISVPGGHRVPVRAKRGGPDEKHVKKDVFYIRRPGPQSAPPQTAEEWNQLIHRCVMSDRDALLDNLRAALGGEPSREAEPTLEESTSTWERESLRRFESLIDEKGARDAYAKGYFTFAYAFADQPDTDSAGLLQHLRATEKQTGWPVWVVFDRAPIAPYPMDGLIECHVWEPGRGSQPGHCDFWRASPEGRLFLLRGHQEDEPESLNEGVSPGTTLDSELPFWRVGECLLHAARLAERLDVHETAVHVRISWTGLRDRRLQNLFGMPADRFGGPTSRQDVVRAQLTVDADRIRLQLVDLVSALTRPLFEVFGFARPQERVVRAALQKMLGRTGDALH